MNIDITWWVKESVKGATVYTLTGKAVRVYSRVECEAYYVTQKTWHKVLANPCKVKMVKNRQGTAARYLLEVTDCNKRYLAVSSIIKLH